MFLLTKCRYLLYNILVTYQAWKLRTLYGMEIGKGTLISRKANLDKAVNPKGIHIGSYPLIGGHVCIIAHDACRTYDGKHRIKADVKVGNNCFVGYGSILLPGVTIGDEVIVGAGSVVTKDVPSNSIVAGNPARVIREGVHLGHYGKTDKKGKNNVA